MQSAFDLVHALTDQGTPVGQRRGLAEEFAHTFGWRPNDFLDAQSSLTTASLLVEQSLDNAAVLSFIPSDRRLRDIQVDERQSILGLSYNSLVDWHVWIDRNSIGYIYNRTHPPTALPAREFDQSDYSPLTKLVFDQATGRAPNPNVPALDTALMDTIFQWRRILRSEIGPSASNASMSSLFNAIILARAIEDLQSKLPTAHPRVSLRDQIRNHGVSITTAIERALVQPTGSPVTRELFDPALLEPFEQLAPSSAAMLIDAFYRHRAVPYDYDFSVISKHALSKIYERYVAVMQHDESIQLALFPSPPSESWNKRLGGIYTPQYIASFFTRYLQQEMTPDRFLSATIADPACGSGIFLRSAMEQKLSSSRDPLVEDLEAILQSLFGVDVDTNAVAASRLSLALLHLAVREALPEDTPIIRGDAIALFEPESSDRDSSFDVVMVNPPFIRTELQSDEVRRAIARHLGFVARGKLDIYLAFVTLSIRALKPGGFGLFVIPQPLLTSQELGPLRNWIREQTWIRLVADLSAIRIFDANVYVALLIVQRKDETAPTAPPVSLISCQGDVGGVLEDFLDGRRGRGSSFLMFDAPQAAMTHATWSVRTPEETRLLSTLEAMPSLKSIALVSQGVVTGGDYAFLLDADDVPAGEEALYRPFLPDRSIGQFVLPEETGRRILYPFFGDAPATASELEADFPTTWARLNRNRTRLSERAPVRRGNVKWWQPAWPRRPRDMLGPKIVSPEISLVPRFGVDASGHWVVSHSPLVRVRQDGDNEALFVVAAILNSSVATWFITSNARKFRDGANKLTVGLLRSVPIPDLSAIRLPVLRTIVSMARELVGSSQDLDRNLASELDYMVLRELYRLDDDDIELLDPWGIEGGGSDALP